MAAVSGIGNTLTVINQTTITQAGYSLPELKAALTEAMVAAKKKPIKANPLAVVQGVWKTLNSRYGDYLQDCPVFYLQKRTEAPPKTLDEYLCAISTICMCAPQTRRGKEKDKAENFQAYLLIATAPQDYFLLKSTKSAIFQASPEDSKTLALIAAAVLSVAKQVILAGSCDGVDGLEALFEFCGSYLGITPEGGLELPGAD